LGQLHDSILFEVPDANAEEAGSIIKETMETLPVAETFGYYMPVPIVADVAIVQHWGGK
jgi:DNA polymerase I-like protein with 3'-5' exonuclease and polymerase domains